ncbi:TetR/AcrR family transcriptional regulator [Virgibacillus sp. W0430]|uniref:TetR/AcrR family transcriptional regulator n=1 Tax=Virgibacillus sp. W0430 TaxID=3391580 RepID=UPI003F48BDE0
MDKKKRQVIETALSLFSKEGFAAISIQDIITEANISKGTFYNYFSSKSAFLIAIMEYVNEELILHRRALQLEGTASNKEIFAKQIMIRLELNTKHNIIPIFEAALHSNDRTLKKFIQEKHLEELDWIAQRLLDIYGERAAPYTIDCAIIMLGIIQHMNHYWNANCKGDINIEALIYYTVRRTDRLMADKIDSKDAFICRFVNERTNKQQRITKHDIVSKIEALHTAICEEEQEIKSLISFLKEEFNEQHPRYFLIKPIVQSFESTFKNTPYVLLANEIAQLISTYIGGKLDDELHCLY